MKKIIFILVAVLVTTFSSYGQLQTKTIENARGYKTVYKFWMGYGEIRKFESGFILFGASTNQFENSMHSIYLGDDKNSAIQSLKDLGELKKNCKDVVVVIGANQKETKIINPITRLKLQFISNSSDAFYFDGWIFLEMIA